MCRILPLFVQVRRPVVQILRPAYVRTCGNDCVRMKSGKKNLAIEAIHAAAEPHETIENVLPVEERSSLASFWFEFAVMVVMGSRDVVADGTRECLNRRPDGRAALIAQ